MIFLKKGRQPYLLGLIALLGLGSFSATTWGEQSSFDSILKLQIALDRKNFSPGCLTGELNGQTRQAIAAFQKSRGLPATGQADAEVLRLLKVYDMEWATHVVSRIEEASLMTLPKTWPEKAELDRIGYETIAELVAEKYHSTVKLVRKMNPLIPWPNPPAGTHLKVPKVTPSKRLQANRLEVRMAEKTVQAFDAEGNLIAHFPCSIAEKPEKRPHGSARIKNCADNPNYTYDPAIFTELTLEERGTRKRLIAPGPNNPVGVAWIGLDIPGYGLHGTPDPEAVGITGSKGCFRLANWNAKKLIDMIRIGMRVEIE